MSSERNHPDDTGSKPRWLRWETSSDGRGAVLRAPWWTPILLGLAALWNLCLPTLTRPSASFDLFTTVGLVAGALFAYFALRGLVNTTRIRFASGAITVATGPLWPRASVAYDIRDTRGFVAEPDDVKTGEGHVVSLVTRSEVRLPLPLRLNGIMLTIKGAEKPFTGVAPPEHAAYVARQLEDILDVVRREGGQYRIAPGLDLAPQEHRDEAEHEASDRARAKR